GSAHAYLARASWGRAHRSRPELFRSGRGFNSSGSTVCAYSKGIPDQTARCHTLRGPDDRRACADSAPRNCACLRLVAVGRNSALWFAPCFFLCSWCRGERSDLSRSFPPSVFGSAV